MPGNSNLHDSKNAKADEFYTPLTMIENELKHYRNHFKGKTVLCNCDDPRVSNFFRYFVMFFDVLELKKVIATCYKNDDADLFSQEATEKAVYLEYDGSIKYTGEEDFAKIPCKELKGNGDFRSKECIAFIEEADIVVTNPPFSLFKEFIPFLYKYNKKFLVIGNINSSTFTEIFPLIQTNKLWLGYNSGHFWFQVPDYYEEKKTDFKIEGGIKYRRMGNICWYTNLEIDRKNELLETGKRYSESEYQKYDNFDALHISEVTNIPMDYEGIMGVPITFLTKYNPAQYKIIGKLDGGSENNKWDLAKPILNGAAKYKRLAIQKIGK